MCAVWGPAGCHLIFQPPLRCWCALLPLWPVCCVAFLFACRSAIWFRCCWRCCLLAWASVCPPPPPSRVEKKSPSTPEHLYAQGLGRQNSGTDTVVAPWSGGRAIKFGKAHATGQPVRHGQPTLFEQHPSLLPSEEKQKETCHTQKGRSTNRHQHNKDHNTNRLPAGFKRMP